METVMRLIDADAIPEVSWDQKEEAAFRATINKMPTIEAEPVRRGKWLHTEDDIIISGQCSECGWVSAVGETDVAGMPYCPNCGARMEGKYGIN